MKNLLLTGFEPFGGEQINPSFEAVKRLPDIIGEFNITKLLLPVVFGEAAEIVLNKATELKPDAILCIGQAGGRAAITPELVAINLRYARIPDNKGQKPMDEPIANDGESAYFSTLPMRKIADAISSNGLPAQLSYSAGAYVCNDLLYTLLSRLDKDETKVGFIHIPYCTDQQKEPSMDLDDIQKGLVIAIENIE